MQVDIRPVDRLRGLDPVDLQGALGPILAALREATVDLSQVRVVCDWIQYRNNFEVWDHLDERHALPEELYVVELGVGNGNQARTWLDAFVELDRDHGRDYSRRLRYLMGDYSPHVLERVRRAVADHGERVSALVLDATRPAVTLGFLRGKAFLVYISNVYDNLPSDELATIRGRTYQVEVQAYLPEADAARIAGRYGLVDPGAGLGPLVDKLLRLGPELLVETLPDRFPELDRAVGFWRDTWDALRLRERYRPLDGLDLYQIAPGLTGELLRPLLEADGDIRMHVSNGALSSFAETLPLLHPFGRLHCHDLFVTDRHAYHVSFHGPGKYDGSVVNWVNGPLLQLVGNRRGVEARLPRPTPTLLPTTVVGSYSVPEWLERLKTDYYQRRISAQHLAEIHEVAIKAALKDQELAGIDIVSDGELRRDNDTDYFLTRIAGIHIPRHAKTDYFDYYDAEITRPLPEGEGMSLGLAEDFAFTREHTDRPIKFSFTGPFSLSRRIRDQAYAHPAGLVLALARRLNAEARELAGAGATLLQIDEPFLAGYPEAVGLAVEAVNLVTEEVEVEWALHVCYGNRYARPSWAGHYDFLFPAALEARVGQLVLEFARKGLDDLRLLREYSWDRRLGFGVIDVKRAGVETADLVARRIRRALEVMPPDRLVINPDCGLRHLPAAVARAKLRAMVAGAAQARGELGTPVPASSPLAVGEPGRTIAAKDGGP